MHALRYALLGGMALLPLVMVPASWFSQLGVKVVWLGLVLTVGLLWFVVVTWRRGELLVPQTAILALGALIPVAYGLSALFATSKSVALLGYNFSADSLVVIFLGFIAMGLSVVTYADTGFLVRIQRVLLGSIVVLALLFTIQTLAAAGSLPTWLTLGGASFVNSWLDVAALVGLGILLVLSLGNHLSRVTVSVSLAVLIAVLTLFVSTPWVWGLLGLAAAVHLAQRIMKAEPRYSWQRAYVVPLVVLVVALSAVFDGVVLQGKVMAAAQRITQVSFIDVRPSWGGTLDIGKSSLLSDGTHMLFGPGVGSFGTQWRLYKPEGVNTTDFWNTDFATAIGFIPTSVVTGGLVVFAAWTLFLAAVLWSIGRARGVYTIPAVYLWVLAIVSPLGVVSVAYAFMLTGLALAEMVTQGKIRLIKFHLSGERASNLMRYGALPLLVLLMVVVLGVVGHRTIAYVYLQRAAQALMDKNANQAELLLNTAQHFADPVMVQRGYTQLALTQLSALLQQSETETKPSAEELQTALGNVLAHARRAIELDPMSPQNYMALGSISEQLMLLGVRGAGESALAAYQQAAVLDPKNPAIPYAAAQVYLAQEDTDNALTSLEAALTLKGNLIPALYEYGVIKLSQGDTNTAIQALGTAVQLNQNYANALYYLSMALTQEGRFEEALVVMRRVAQLNPDNEDVAKIVDELTVEVQARNVATPTPSEQTDTTGAETE